MMYNDTRVVVLMPSAWHKKLRKEAAQRFDEFDKPISLAEMIREVLDKQFKLSNSEEEQ